MLKEEILRSTILNVKGTTKLVVGDPEYLEAIRTKTDREAEKELVFDGSISAAPLGRMVIQEKRVFGIDDETMVNLDYKEVNIHIYQGSEEKMLDVYAENKFYKGTEKAHHELGCDHACFYIKTKHGDDYIDTLADGYYGEIRQYKQYYGMNLFTSLDTDAMSYEEAIERFSNLFPIRK